MAPEAGDEADKSIGTKLTQKKNKPSALLAKHSELARAGLAIKPSKGPSRSTIKVKKK